MKARGIFLIENISELQVSRVAFHLIILFIVERIFEVNKNFLHIFIAALKLMNELVLIENLFEKEKYTKI